MLGVKQRERDDARIGQRLPSRSFLRVEVHGAAAVECGEDWVLHGDALRSYGCCIPWFLDQTLAVGDHRQRGHHRIVANGRSRFVLPFTHTPSPKGCFRTFIPGDATCGVRLGAQTTFFVRNVRDLYVRPVARKLMRLTIRFSERTHSLIKREAEIEGVTITQYVREAALSRAYYAIGERGDPPDHAAEALEAARITLGEDADQRDQPDG